MHTGVYCIYYYNNYRKPKLPIEMEISKEKENVDFEHQLDYWDPDEIVQHASKMSKLKKAIYSKARENITAAQKKDKEYYDNKHSSLEVWLYYNYFNITIKIILYYCNKRSELALLAHYFYTCMKHGINFAKEEDTNSIIRCTHMLLRDGNTIDYYWWKIIIQIKISRSMIVHTHLCACASYWIT